MPIDGHGSFGSMLIGMDMDICHPEFHGVWIRINVFRTHTVLSCMSAPEHFKVSKCRAIECALCETLSDVGRAVSDCRVPPSAAFCRWHAASLSFSHLHRS